MFHFPIPLKRSLIVIFIFLLSSSIYSQGKAVEINYKRNDDKSISFSFKKKNPGSTYIIVNFNKFENAKGKPTIKKTIKGFSGNLLKLEPLDEKRGISFSFSYTYLIGTSRTKIDRDFKYVLPFKNDKEVKALDLNYVGKRFGNSSPKNWKSIQFLTKPNELVYAARKGMVVAIKNGFSEDTKGPYSYKSEANHIIIEHDDGTLAKYGVLKKNSMLVKLGQKVYPSTPIASAGTYDTEKNSQLRFGVYYLDKEVLNSYKKGEKQTLGNQKHYYAYVNPIFYTKSEATQLISGEQYIATYNDAIVEFEMSKREKKKWLKMKNEKND